MSKDNLNTNEIGKDDDLDDAIIIGLKAELDDAAETNYQQRVTIDELQKENEALKAQIFELQLKIDAEITQKVEPDAKSADETIPEQASEQQ